jgi:hypothetical protein
MGEARRLSAVAAATPEGLVRLILSRKGFDSDAGGAPNPIFEDGTMLSLPIPERGSPRTYASTTCAGRCLGPLVEQLTRGRVKPTYGLHLDPDLVAETLPRAPGWRPAFGQAHAAQGILAREGITTGDLFLFFGWFRQVKETPKGVAYRRLSPHMHVLFGWLQIGEVFRPQDDEMPPWTADHPHVVQPDRPSNTLYIAAEHLTLGGKRLPLPGAGIFPRYRDELRLTTPGQTRSVWSLPSWFAPRAGRLPLSGHSKAERWAIGKDRLQLRSVGRGQEFVLDMGAYPEAMTWVRDIITAGTSSTAPTR